MSILSLYKLAKLENKLVQTFSNTFQALHSVQHFLYSLKERKITPESQKMRRPGVKITKSPIIRQICKFQVKKFVKRENKFVQTFYNTFQSLFCIFFLFSLKERKIAHESQKMPFGGVKITKSPIIQQIYKFEV